MIEKIKKLFPNIDISIPVLSCSNTVTFLDNEFVEDLSDFYGKLTKNVDTQLSMNIDKTSKFFLNIFFIGTKLNKSKLSIDINVLDFANLDISIFVLDSSKSELCGDVNFVLYNSSAVKTRVLYIDKFSSKYDVNLSMHHIKSNSNSDVNVKGIVYDNSDVTLNMKIIVDKLVQSTTSSEVHKVLKLSPSAVVQSIPAIVCSTEGSVINHGFALSGFDNNQLSFLYSRGINRQNAELLLKDAFISSL